MVHLSTYKYRSDIVRRHLSSSSSHSTLCTYIKDITTNTTLLRHQHHSCKLPRFTNSSNPHQKTSTMHQSQSSSSISFFLFSISLLSTTASALPQEWSASVAATTIAPIVATSAAPVNWETAVTWPAGCESWANPCPAGALTSGMAPTPTAVTWPAGCQTWADPCPATALVSAGEPYSNPFTSYTTMTNSAGIITGMPSVATSAGGVASVLSEQSVAEGATSSPTTLKTAISSGASSSVVMLSASATSFQSASATTDNTFSQATFSAAAAANRAVGAGVAVMAMGIALVL